MPSLSGTLPFYADNPDDFLELVLNSNFSFPDSEWEGVSEGGTRGRAVPRLEFTTVLTPWAWTAQDLIRKILVPEPRRRYTIPQILAHPWMQQNSKGKKSSTKTKE